MEAQQVERVIPTEPNRLILHCTWYRLILHCTWAMRCRYSELIPALSPGTCGLCSGCAVSPSG